MLRLLRGPTVETVPAPPPAVARSDDDDGDDDRVRPTVYPKRIFRFQIGGAAQQQHHHQQDGGERTLDITLSSYTSLPLFDAVSLLSGEDNTGLMQWSGSVATAQWLLDHPQLLRAPTSHPRAATAPFTTVVVELGCGAGLLGVVCASILSGDEQCLEEGVDRRNVVICTDSNLDCIELAQRNLRDNASATTRTSLHALHYRWGDDFSPVVAASAAEGATGESSANSGAGKIVVVAGDVIYDATAPAALISAVTRLREAMPPGYELHFVLGFMPREWAEASSVARWADVLRLAAAAGLSVQSTHDVLLVDGAPSGGRVAHFVAQQSAASS